MRKEISENLAVKAAEVRKDIIRMIGISGFGPLKESLSVVDVFVYLYWEELLVLPNEPNRFDRDRVFLGMEEAVPALYAVLANRGFFSRDELWHYRRLGSILQALPEPNRVLGVDSPCACGDQILSMASPVAQELSRICPKPRVICICSGTNLTEIFFDEIVRAGQAKIGNLILLIIKVTDSVGREKESEIEIYLENRWTVHTVNGNNFIELEKVFNSLNYEDSSPKAIFVNIKRMGNFRFVDNLKYPKPRAVRLETVVQALKELEVENE